MAKLSKEERDLMKSVEAGEWRSVRGLKKELIRHRSYAEATFKKDRRPVV
jgi:hypothetical protein